MASSESRRVTDPLIVQQIWAAIQYIRMQKQMANSERIARYMEREHEMTMVEAEKQLEYAVDENLVEEYTHGGMKGIKRTSEEQQGYRIPETPEDWDKGSHDWYCFECHKNGSVICCTECYRVYHPMCIHGDIDYDMFVCTLCQQQEIARKRPRIRRKELNRLLYFAVGRLKEKTKELHKMGMKNEPRQFRRFMYQCMDLNSMEQKTLSKKYKYIEQFKADAQTLYHNVFICYGESGGMAQLARIMIVDCQYDLDEIDLCKDCYYYSNAKPKDWFALPCNPRHELVFAKQKGFCYWPAKVIQIIATGYDVRFFGGLHQRAVIPENNIRPIDATEKSLNVKKTGAYTKSMDELRRHQKHLLDDNLEAREDFEDDDLDMDDWAAASKEKPSSPAPAKRGRKPKQFTEPDGSEDWEDSKPAPLPKRGRKSKQFTEPEDMVDDWDTASKPTPPPSGGKRGRKPKVALDNDFEDWESKPSPVPPTKKRRKSKQTPKAIIEDEEFDEPMDDLSEMPSIKKFRRSSQMEMDDNRISSSLDKSVLTPEDAHLVTSSEDNVQPSPRIISTKDLGTQTSKKFTQCGKNRGVQTDSNVTKHDGKQNDGTCDCDSRYQIIIDDLKEEHREELRRSGIEETVRKFSDCEDKEEAMEQLREELQKTFEEDKQQAVSRAVANLQKEVDKGKRSTEDKLRQEYMEEMKKLAQKHKAELSVTKKKQWCYNCEEEAMYHCCWNTSYCSIKCQQENWHKEHKRMCRRKR